MRSTRNRSIATKMCRMKKTTDAISGICRKESVRVALLQTLGEDGATWSTLRWSLNDLSSVQFFQMYWEGSTNSFCIESTRLPSYDRWNLSARLGPSGCRLLQFDQCWVAIHEMLSRFASGRESLQNSSWCISFSNYGKYGVVFVLQSSHDGCHEVVPSKWHNFWIERRSNVHWSILRLDWFSFKRCPQVQ